LSVLASLFGCSPDYILTCMQTICQVIGVVGVFALIKQIYDGTKWNKLNFTVNRLDRKSFRENMEIVKEHGMGGSKPLSKEGVNKITSNIDRKLTTSVNAILNDLEDVATLYNAKAMDSNIAYEMYGPDMITIYSKFKGVIERYCENEDQNTFIGIKKCVKSFERIKQKKMAKGGVNKQLVKPETDG